MYVSSRFLQVLINKKCTALFHYSVVGNFSKTLDHYCVIFMFKGGWVVFFLVIGAYLKEYIFDLLRKVWFECIKLFLPVACEILVKILWNPPFACESLV